MSDKKQPAQQRVNVRIVKADDPEQRGGMKISIHALREEGDLRLDQTIDQQAISIHALREEGDSITFSRRTAFCDFYPRPPRGGRPKM